MVEAAKAAPKPAGGGATPTGRDRIPSLAGPIMSAIKDIMSPASASPPPTPAKQVEDSSAGSGQEDELAALREEHARVLDENVHLRRMLQTALSGDGSFARHEPDADALSDLRTKKATVRIGLLDTDAGRFFELGSGVLVSEGGHVLTAAHTFVGTSERGRRFMQFLGGRFAAHVVICVGLYQGEGKPALWRHRAELLTPVELMQERHAGDGAGSRHSSARLLDLAVLRIVADVELDPPAWAPDASQVDEARLYEPCERCGRPYARSAPHLYQRVRVVSMAPTLATAPPHAYLPLGNADATAVGDELRAAGWPSPHSQQAIYVDRSRLISREHGFLKSKLFLHAASSGGPCLNSSGEVIGIASSDLHAHASSSYESWFRSTGLLRAEHGLPTELLPPESLPALLPDGRMSTSLDEVLQPRQPVVIGPFEPEPLDPQAVGNFSVQLLPHLRGGVFRMGSMATTGRPITGELSPLHPITLQGLSRETARIPADALYYAYAYPAELPPSRLHPDEQELDPCYGMAGGELGRSFANIGGYVYFTGAGHH